jgi:hypothetical protein
VYVRARLVEMPRAIVNFVEQQLLRKGEVNLSAFRSLKLHVLILDSSFEAFTPLFCDIFQDLAQQQETCHTAFPLSQTNVRRSCCKVAHLYAIQLSISTTNHQVKACKILKQCPSGGAHARSRLPYLLQDVKSITSGHSDDSDAVGQHKVPSTIVSRPNRHSMNDRENLQPVIRGAFVRSCTERLLDRPVTQSLLINQTKSALDGVPANSVDNQTEANDCPAPQIDEQSQNTSEHRFSEVAEAPHASQLAASLTQRSEDRGDEFLNKIASALSITASLPGNDSQISIHTQNNTGSFVSRLPIPQGDPSTTEQCHNLARTVGVNRQCPANAPPRPTAKGSSKLTIQEKTKICATTPAPQNDNPGGQSNDGQGRSRTPGSTAISTRNKRSTGVIKHPAKNSRDADDGPGGQDPDRSGRTLPEEPLNLPFCCPAYAASASCSRADRCQNWQNTSINAVTRHVLIDAGEGTQEWFAIKRLSTSKLTAESRWQKYFCIFKGIADGAEIGQPYRMPTNSGNDVLDLLSLLTRRLEPIADARGLLSDVHRYQNLLDTQQQRKDALRVHYDKLRLELDEAETKDIAAINAEFGREVNALLGRQNEFEQQEPALALPPIVQVTPDLSSRSGDLQGLTLPVHSQPSSFSGSEAGTSMTANFDTSFNVPLVNPNSLSVSSEPFPSRIMETYNPAVVETGQQVRQAVGNNHGANHREVLPMMEQQQRSQYRRQRQGHSDGPQGYRGHGGQNSRPPQHKTQSDSGLGESAYTPTTNPSDSMMPEAFSQALATDSFDLGNGILAQGLGHGLTTWMGALDHDDPTSSGFQIYDQQMSGQ